MLQVGGPVRTQRYKLDCYHTVDSVSLRAVWVARETRRSPERPDRQTKPQRLIRAKGKRHLTTLLLITENILICWQILRAYEMDRLDRWSWCDPRSSLRTRIADKLTQAQIELDWRQEDSKPRIQIDCSFWQAIEPAKGEWGLPTFPIWRKTGI